MTGHAQTDRWVRRFHPAPDAKAVLVCLPHAGGAASYYFPFSRALSPRIDVLSIQYPGRQNRSTEKCLDSVPALADAVAGAVLPWAGRPIALFGHSMGASVGFEVALRMEAEKVTPTMLFVSGRRAPSRHRDEQVRLCDDDGLIADVRALAGTDARLLVDDEMLRMALPAIRADYTAAETYRYPANGVRLHCPVHAFLGDTDPKTTVDEIRAWSDHTTGEFTINVYPGGHFYLNSAGAEVIDVIATRLTC